MKKLIIYTIIITFISLAIAIPMSLLSSHFSFTVEDVWIVCGGWAFFLLGVPWFCYVSFLFIRYATYEIRKVWLKAAEDAKNKE